MARKSRRKRGAGRKRKNLPRTQSGRLSRSTERRVIERTQSAEETRASLAELRSGRARGLGLSEEQSAHPMSETIAGRMALRGSLSFVEAEAIDEYAKIVRRAAMAMRSPPGPRCSLNLSRGGSSKDDAELYAAAMRRYNDAFAALREAGERANRAVNIIVRDLRDLPLSEHSYARIGAAALMRHFGLDHARAA